ncbi:flagellar protein FliT [Marinimicrobium alkaliphilum]|uniref:flagellar protein FliT n=1 Tax=Marinimicrobium alkaliphilum TaxID=2202654 RepID=UPI000DB9BFEC|nr:flagellar protein FliT [Marinimicrobium alkaliphilum]
MTNPHESTCLNPVYQAIDQSRRLLALAREDDWATFEQVLAERQESLEALKSSEFMVEVVKNGYAEVLREAIVELQALNEQVGELAETSKARLSEQLKEFARGDKAKVAYGK